MPKIVDHDERLDSISHAACAVIARVPLDRLTLRDIASAAGCTTGAVTHYFADKGQVLAAASDTRAVRTVSRNNTPKSSR